MAKYYGYSLDKICLNIYGACINLENNCLQPKHEIIIALAGPVFSVFCGFAFISLWWIWPTLYAYTYYFVLANFVTALINILPCFPLDGGRVFKGILQLKFSNNKAVIISFWSNIFFSSLLVLCFIISMFIKTNFSFLIMAIFIFVSVCTEKYSGTYSLLFMKTNKPSWLNRGLQVNSFAINSNATIFQVVKKTKQHQYNLIYIIFANGDIKIINEKNLEKLSTKYSLNTKLEDAFLLEKVINK